VENPAIETFTKVSSAGLELTDELGRDGLLGDSLLVVEEVTVETFGSSPFGPVKSASLTANGIVHPISLGRQFRRREYELVLTGHGTVGSCNWDVDEEPSWDLKLSACPVMRRQNAVSGHPVSECLVLCATGNGSDRFERTGRGIVTDFWARVDVQRQRFTMV
jgi:hypothetical protein